MPNPTALFYDLVDTASKMDEIVKLARVIWVEHYTPIIGIEQVEYMLTKLHSRDVIEEDIRHKHFHYFLIKVESASVGYIGLQIRPEELFLSKLYISSQSRGSGYGKSAMTFIQDFAREHNLNSISLTVNKHNKGAIAAYHKFGFSTVGEVCINIGGGYFMDDYQMELTVSV